LGFILLAKGAAGLFLTTEVLHQTLYVLLVLALIGPFGLAGVGMAFTFLYVVYSVLILTIAVWKYGFRYSRRYPPLLVISLALTMGAFFLKGVGDDWARYTLGAALSMAACIMSGLILKRLMGLGDVGDVLRFIAGLAGAKKGMDEEQ
jgi:hypothetical protein